MSAPTTFDPESIAIDAFLRLSKLIEERASLNKCKPLVSKSSNLVELIAQTGLITATLFYMSKSDKTLYKKLVEAINQQNPDIDEDNMKELINECQNEGIGYTLSLALLAHAIDSLARMSLIPPPDNGPNPCIRPEIANFKDLAKCLLYLRSQKAELTVERLLAPYLNTIKRMSEAFYKK